MNVRTWIGSLNEQIDALTSKRVASVAIEASVGGPRQKLTLRVELQKQITKEECRKARMRH